MPLKFLKRGDPMERFLGVRLSSPYKSLLISGRSTVAFPGVGDGKGMDWFALFL